MKQVEPEVFLVGRTAPNPAGMAAYLDAVGGQAPEWMDSRGEPRTSPEDLVEFGGRICYRSWAPGLNPNVTKIRPDQDAYLANILAQHHGSVTEHASWSFVFHNVSRVMTHELARHRPGVAISQESMRFVRLDEIPFWFPDWAQADPELMAHAVALLNRMEEFQLWMADHFGLDEPGRGIAGKKHKTSFMRRFAPDGVATGVLWSANVRTLRHVIEARTAPGAEEEIRLVFGMVAEIMQAEAPALFGDFTRHEDGSWVPEHHKI